MFVLKLMIAKSMINAPKEQTTTRRLQVRPLGRSYCDLWAPPGIVWNRPLELLSVPDYLNAKKS